MSDLKNVVIIGAASGAIVARALEKSLPATHRIVIVEASETAYWAIGALRGAVVPGQEDNIFARLDTFFPKGSRHIMLNKTKVTAISGTSVTVDHQVEPFGSTEIPIDYAVLATGSLYSAPCRPASTSMSEAKASLKKQQADVAAATSFLIVGGGAVGAEFAGEVLAAHPNKKVTLVTRDSVLLGKQWVPKFPAKVEGQLQRMGAEILYDSSVDLEGVETNVLLSSPQDFKAGSTTVSADFVLIATGGKPNVEIVPEAALSEGRIAVDSNLRLTYAPLKERYFALGDAANAEGAKTHYVSKFQAAVVANNIVAVIKSSSALQEWKPPSPLLAVPIGPRDGSTFIMGWTVGGFITSLVKGRTLFQSMFTGLYGQLA